MKRTLLAVIVVLSLALAGVGGTFAGFSDTEMSRDNVFEVAALDLKVAKADFCWQPWDDDDGFDFRDDLPWGDGLVAAFDIYDAELRRIYISNHVLWDVGEPEGGLATAYLHIRVTEDSATLADTTSTSIADTTTFLVWYDDDGMEDIDLDEIIPALPFPPMPTLDWFDCNRLELGPLPACEPRRLTLLILPKGGCQETITEFSLGFDIEFQLVQVDHSLSDTETTFGYLAGTASGEGEGCTPGYWKNHTGAWLNGYSPGDEVADVFVEAAAYPDLNDDGDDDTLLDALNFHGGPRDKGAARILLRAAVAAVLNAAHPDVSYPRLKDDVIEDVDDALDSGDRATMIALAGALDIDNNQGCPLGRCQSCDNSHPPTPSSLLTKILDK